MAKVGDLFVSIGGNVSGLNAALGRAGGMLSSFAGRVASTALGTALPGMISSLTNGFAGSISGAINSASDLNETLSKTDVLLGGQAQRAKDFAAEMQNAGKAGMRETLDSVTNIVGAMQNLGSNTDTAISSAMELQKRFNDVASQQNKSVEEVQAAYQSLLAGSIEPMRALNVFTSVDKLNKAGKPFGEAAFAEFMKQTSQASGDFDRTKYSYSNLQKSGNIASQGMSGALGQNLLLVGQAFQYFRLNFLGQITSIISGGVLKKAGESLYNGVASLGFSFQALIPIITETLASWATKLASVLESIAVVLAAAIENPTAMWGVITDSIGLALLSVKEKLWTMASRLTGGMVKNDSLAGQRQTLEDSLAANMGSLGDTRAGIQGKVADLKSKLLSDGGSAPLLTGSSSLVAQGTQSKTSSFTSLLDGVMATAQEKQIAVLERIDAGIQAIASKGPQGAKSVIEKTSLSTIATPQVAGAF